MNVSAEEDDDVIYVRVKDASGTLCTGLVTIGGKKFCFGDNGVLELGSVIPFKNKYYALNPEAEEKDPSSWYIDATGKDHISGVLAVKKDGTIPLSGWFSADEKKYYVIEGSPAIAAIFGTIKVKGKIYKVNNDGSIAAGWQTVSGEIFDVDLFSPEPVEGSFYYYFNPKTGAAETGWKTLNALKVQGNGDVAMDDGIPLVTGTKKKIYFNKDKGGAIPQGALVRKTDFTIGKKTYRFGADGAVLSGKEGFASVDITDGGADNLNSYIKADGTKAKGRTAVKTNQGSRYYYFATSTGSKETSVLRLTGKKWYYYGADGQQSTSLVADEYYDNDGVPYSKVKAAAVFNSDGSLKNFVMSNNTGLIIRNALIRIGTGEYYMLGDNGLPITGFVECPALKLKIFVESDGRNSGSYLKTGYDYTLSKVGSKYYVLYNGAAPGTAGAKKLEDLDISAIPAADLAELRKTLKFRNSYYRSDPESINVYYEADGSVRTGELSVGGRKYHYNKFGMCKADVTFFYKHGSTWYLSAGADASLRVGMSDYNTSLSFDTVLRSDSNGKLLPIIDKNTGKTASGLFIMESDEHGDAYVWLKNGKIVTGKIKIHVEDVIPVTIELDKDYGIGVGFAG